jgi:hypothetical protein
MKRTEINTLDPKKRCIKCLGLKRLNRFGQQGYSRVICVFCRENRSKESLNLYEENFNFDNFYQRYPEELSFRSDEFSLKEITTDENLSS